MKTSLSFSFENGQSFNHQLSAQSGLSMSLVDVCNATGKIVGVILDESELLYSRISTLMRYNPSARAHMDDHEEWNGDTDPLTVGVQDVRLAIEKSNSHAAAGYTAWTFALVKALSDRLDGTSPWFHSITRLFNMMLDNRVPSRAMLLPKGDTAWRQLGIGEC
eukprot:gene13622-9755_t